MNGPSGIIHNRQGVKAIQMLINWWEFTNKAWYTGQYIIGYHSVSEGITLSPGVWGQPEHKWGSRLKSWSLSISPFWIFPVTTVTSLRRLPAVIFLSLARQTHVITVTCITVSYSLTQTCLVVSRMVSALFSSHHTLNSYRVGSFRGMLHVDNIHTTCKDRKAQDFLA